MELINCNSGLIFLIVILAVWDFVFKMVALWKSARNGHKAWFILLAILNTVGILPLIYIFTAGKKK